MIPASESELIASSWSLPATSENPAAVATNEDGVTPAHNAKIVSHKPRDSEAYGLLC